jgi:hypothetical protein
MNLWRVKAFALMLMVFTTMSFARAISFEYDWVTATSGFSGKIFLDASSNSNGSVSDVDLANSFITTPDGTFSFTTYDPFNSSSPLIWNSTQITSMDIEGAQSPAAPGFPSNSTAFWGTTATSVSDNVYLTSSVMVLISDQFDRQGM